MWNGELIRGPEVCKAGPALRMECYHGSERVLKVPCGKIGECDVCKEQWRRRVRRKIAEGVRRYSGDPWLFVTLTMCPHKEVERGMCVRCGRAERLDASEGLLVEGMEAWKKFRKWLWRRSGGKGRTFRVVELTKKGVLHIHAVTDVDLPMVEKPGNKEVLDEWISRLSDEGRDFVAGPVMGSGFGPICHVERVRRGSGGVSAYLSKYLTKAQGKGLLTVDGRRHRVAEGTRTWYSGGSLEYYWWGRSGCTGADVVVKEVECFCGRRDKHQHLERRRYEDGMAIARWSGEAADAQGWASGYREISREVARKRSRAWYRGGGSGAEKAGAEAEKAQRAFTEAKGKRQAWQETLRQVGYNGPYKFLEKEWMNEPSKSGQAHGRTYGCG